MTPRPWCGCGPCVAAVVALGVALCVAPVAVAFENPNAITSADLVETPKVHDGAAITFEGEAIGEAMARGEHAWLHLNDDAYMYENVEEGAALDGYNSGMPVWVESTDAEKVGTFGDYEHEGDVVRVSGIFNAACREHGGDMDIHAEELEVLIPGRRALDPVKPKKIPVAILLVATSLGLWFASRWQGILESRGRRRKGR